MKCTSQQSLATIEVASHRGPFSLLCRRCPVIASRHVFYQVDAAHSHVRVKSFERRAAHIRHASPWTRGGWETEEEHALKGNGGSRTRGRGHQQTRRKFSREQRQEQSKVPNVKSHEQGWGKVSKVTARGERGLTFAAPSSDPRRL